MILKRTNLLRFYFTAKRHQNTFLPDCRPTNHVLRDRTYVNHTDSCFGECTNLISKGSLYVKL